MVAITKFLIIGLMTVAVQALPQPQAAAPSTTMAPAPVATKDAKALAVEIFSKLFTAPTAVKRFQALLTKDAAGMELLTGDELKKQTVFPFTPKVNSTTAKGGVTVSANIESFPILTGLGISTTLGFMEPCGINTPHVHPRATEFLTLVEGENLRFGYVLENALVAAGQNPEVAGTMNKFEGTVFPQGSIHFQFNDNCDKAVFVAALNSEDPGTNQVAQGFFALNSGVVNATLGFPKEINGQNIAEFRKMIPANLAQDIDVCLAKCNGKN
ncbi:RmlC-like cupin domain-containing protein [Ampelomyces quisqualis]|uniref:RmlC-like cupin domain-containing protein n=1 Tax=Ampelomyces quisqualis TaxID=50730 RepID=A0A6A5QPA2_AMPQU|nr:RmlC-like cupin domain-containing protein [Ampelomyces quisqualis]